MGDEEDFAHELWVSLDAREFKVGVGGDVAVEVGRRETPARIFVAVIAVMPQVSKRASLVKASRSLTQKMSSEFSNSTVLATDLICSLASWSSHARR